MLVEETFMAFICLIISAVLIGIDQLTKFLVSQNIAPAGGGMPNTIHLIDGFLSITYIENTGMALGLLENQRWIFIPLTIVGMLVLAVFLFRYKKHNFWSYSAITLLIAGGIGNLIDRVVRGYVVDFISFSFFPYVFNFADCCVTVGAVMLILAVIFSERQKKRNADKPLRHSEE